MASNINLKPNLYALVKALIGAETLVFADQNAPRPALPYWTIRVQVQRAVGRDYYSQGVTNDGDQQIDGVREATVQVQRIGATLFAYWDGDRAKGACIPRLHPI